MRVIQILLAAALLNSPAIAQASGQCPVYPAGMKKIVYQQIKKESLVRDVYIGQEGCDLKLAVVVSPAANEAYAMAIGDRFVRFTKALGPGPGPKKQIGKGIYNFLVGVFTSSEKRLAMGAKVSGARRLSW